MPTLPADIPRARPSDGFLADPLNFLRRARAEHGDLFVLREPGAIFSRADDSVGVVAVFGLEYQRAVLSDLDSFGMPISAAHRLKLPANLANLNRGLHSLTGTQHTAHRRSLNALLSDCAEQQHDAIADAVNGFIRRWQGMDRVYLLREMRELALSIGRHLLFGRDAEARANLAERMRAYFDLRRELAAPSGEHGSMALQQLTTLGDDIDAELRVCIRACRASSSAADGIVARLARADSFGAPLSEDEVIGHANVLFISSTEPVAVTLTWIFLVLSQMPDLRHALREVHGGGALLDRVIDETLRMLPPNAFMVRTTTRPVMVGKAALPEKCELVLCPFVSHRDPRHFPQPDRFMPQRWEGSAPSPFVYFPFGAGGHFCIGRPLARSVIREAVTRILTQYDLILAHEQELDWRLHVIFMPNPDPEFSVRALPAPGATDSPRLRGPIAAMLQLDIS